MSSNPLSHFYIARIVLENETPLSIAANGSDGVFDLRLVRDANGLPAIPATSITGVLRSLYGEGENELFGFQSKKEGQSSLVQISWAHITDSKGNTLHGLETDSDKIQQDKLLKLAYDTNNAPVIRDRVSISHKGVAKNTGKFDRSVLPAGFRFVCEVSLWSDKANDERWDKLIGLLQHPLFRLGGNTRSGLGKLKVVKAFSNMFDLRQSADRTAFAKLSRRLDDTTGLYDTFNQLQTVESALVTATLTLNPEGFWRIGGGNISHEKADGKEADMLAKTETRIVWDDQGKAEVQVNRKEPLLIPASSIKGTLSHRIVFHDNCLNGVWADEIGEKANELTNALVQNLFGHAKDSDKASGQVGNVIIDDVFLTEKKFGIQMHNCIDRFTGGVRDHMLFSEELAYKNKQPISINMTFDTSKLTSLTAQQKQAINKAIKDLCEGRLALGAGSNKGHGFMTGNCAWSDNGNWIGEAV